MPKKKKKPLPANLRKLETEKWLRRLDQFERTVKSQIRQARKSPPETTSLTLLTGISDKSGEYVMIIHPVGPGPGSRSLKNLVIPMPG
jgi:hypothetical protein